MNLSRKQVMDLLTAQPGTGNKFLNWELGEGETAWNPPGDGTYTGPGTVTYALYRSGGVYATITRQGDI